MKNRIDPRNMYLFLSGATSFLFTLVFTINSIYYIEIINLSPLQLVLVGTVLETVYFTFEIPTGIIADVYSRRLSIIIGVALTGVAFIFEGSIPLYMFVLISQVLWGLGATFLSGATEAWIADFLEEDQLERTYIRAAQVGQVCAFIGIGISVALGTISIRLPILISGILFVILAVVLIVLMPESIFTPLETKELNTWRKMLRTFTSGMTAVRESHFLKMIFLITLVAGLASEGIDRLWTAHIIENFSFPEFADIPVVVWFGIINGIGMIFSIILSQLLIKRMGKSDNGKSVKVLFFINSFYILSIFIFALAGNFSVALASYWSIHMLNAVTSPIYGALIAKNVRPNLRATVISSEGQLNSIGQIIGGPVIGIIATTYSLSAGIFTTGIILLPIVILYLMIIRNFSERGKLGLLGKSYTKDFLS